MAPESITSSQKYGPLYKAQPSSISISDPRDIRQVLSSSQFHKHSYYNILKFTGTESLISTQDPAKTSIKRHMLRPYFNTTHVMKMEPLILDHGIEKLKQLWDTAIAQQKEVNYCETFNFCTFSIISRLVFGQTIDAGNKPTLHWISQAYNYLSIRTILSFLPRPVFRLVTWPWEHHYERINQTSSKRS
ncbi:hypothetical protein LPJ66_004616 [Kickxella alabastrina]|uniref:Uncharacterized protein n=1 Tax=Kickxella alabastrina TaxID=61397 RepID=A0ACC1IKV4_9FUNG|nr:hypothetical protein LPJ66_004616 [Kickxella alabastrina]